MDIYFNKEKHKYLDEFGNTYVSATTLIGKYETKFEDVKVARACEKIGKNPNHPKYLKYKGKTYKQILKEWETIKDIACDNGNLKHDYLDSSIKSSNGFFNIGRKETILSNGLVKLFTIEDIKRNPEVGKLNLDDFVEAGVKDKYPQIFDIIRILIEDNWNVYSEIAVFNYDCLISGTIDVLFIKGNSFIILDWKTNRNPIKFESGYWAKDINGKVTNYVFKDDYFKYPLNKLPLSVGNKYTLQISLYNWMVIQFGYTLSTNILCRITPEIYTAMDEEVVGNLELIDKHKIEILPIKYYENDIINMVSDYSNKRVNNKLSFNYN